MLTKTKPSKEYREIMDMWRLDSSEMDRINKFYEAVFLAN